MTLTKNSTNYTIQDKLGEVNVNGSVALNDDGSINININTDSGEYASYSKNTEGFINFNSYFKEEKDIIDYMQTLVIQIVQELSNIQE